jgi:hypothetical protein
MYISQPLTTLALLSLLGFASAGCYSSGMVADAAQIAAAKESETLDAICSALVGTYYLHEGKSTCMSIGENKYDFTLKYNAEAECVAGLVEHCSPPADTRDIALAECKNGMDKELNCPRGGKTMYTNWEYRYVCIMTRSPRLAANEIHSADYNLGSCTGIVNAVSGRSEAENGTETESQNARREHAREFTA